MTDYGTSAVQHPQRHAVVLLGAEPSDVEFRFGWDFMEKRRRKITQKTVGVRDQKYSAIDVLIKALAPRS
jgi:hypothetical protein